MPHGPSAVGQKLRERKMTPKYANHAPRDLKALANLVTTSELLKPHDVSTSNDSLGFGEAVTLIFETKAGESHFILDSVCGR